MTKANERYHSIDEFHAENRLIENAQVAQSFANLANSISNLLLEKSHEQNIAVDEERIDGNKKLYSKIVNEEQQQIILRQLIVLIKFSNTMDELDLQQRMEWEEVGETLWYHSQDLREYAENSPTMCSLDVEPSSPEEVLALCDHVKDQLREYKSSEDYIF